MNAIDKIKKLPVWVGKTDPQPLAGGITNANFMVEDKGKKFFVRAGEDIPLHGVMRFNELAASQAAAAVGISPRVVYHSPGFLVLEYIDGRTFTEDDVRSPDNLEKILPLVKRCHREVPLHFRGPALIFWVFQVIRDYAFTLKQGNSRLLEQIPELLGQAKTLEQGVGEVEIVFGHNDLLPANFIDDGSRLWLIDFDYAGFNSPLFDLGGLASNNGLSVDQEKWMLEIYFEAKADDGLWRRYQSMKCASLLRESMWSLVSEIHSSLDFDYLGYSNENLSRFRAAMREYQQL